MHDKIIRKLADYSYADVRIERGIKSSVRLSDSEVDAVSGNVFGISVRILKNGSWGVASSNREEDAHNLDSMLRTAERLASLSKGNKKMAGIKLRSAKVKAKSKDPAEIQMEEKVSMLKEAQKHMEGSRVKNKTLSLSDKLAETVFFNSEGIEILQEKCHVYVNCTAIAKSAELMQRGSERAATVDGYSKIDIYDMASKSAKKAERLLDAVAPPAGRMTAVLDPEMTGVFSHEALGHASEADSVVERESILRKRLGKIIGNELVTIVDDPTADYFGNFAFDDEGVEGKKVELVKKGVLSSYLSSRENCDLLGVEANGHARAEDYSSVPIVRMSNTFFLPGKSSKEDVFDVREGVYLKGMKGGSVDIFSGGFMFKADEAYEIKNGELGRILRDTAISGNILETLKNVESVGKDFGTSPGFCGKFGQSVPVSDGGPHIRIKDVKIG
jgi:TldD protein